MTWNNKITLGDEHKWLECGGGLVSEIVDQLSPVERERQRRAAEVEIRQAEAEREAAAERRAEAAWEARRQGREPRTPLEAAAAAHAAQDRQDRRQEAQERRAAAEGGPDLPRRPSVVARELAEYEAAFMAKPATVGDLAYQAAQTAEEIGAVKHVLGRLLGRG